MLKFIYSEKATKFCKISTIDFSYVVTVKSTIEISQNFVAFSEYMNFNIRTLILPGDGGVGIPKAVRALAWALAIAEANWSAVIGAASPNPWGLA